MTPPTPKLHILQNGMSRSGNVWLAHLIRDLLSEAGVPIRQHLDGHPVAEALADEDLGIDGIQHADFIRLHPLRCFYTILENFRWPIADLDAYIASTTHVASHCHWNAASAEVYRRFSHRVYVIRDPRDVAVSAARFMFTPYNRLHQPQPHADPQHLLDAQLQTWTQDWVRHVAAHLHRREAMDIHCLRYERLLLEPTDELCRLAAYLGLTLDAEQMRRVAERNTFTTLKQQQPQHLFKGRWGQWREDLRTGQIRQVRAIAGALLRELDYPLDLTDADGWTPQADFGARHTRSRGSIPQEAPANPAGEIRPL